tara:strand:+ start:1210 stop:1332 length:123 start_codon:yes stop_codon:yes gene_type:complete
VIIGNYSKFMIVFLGLAIFINEPALLAGSIATEVAGNEIF